MLNLKFPDPQPAEGGSNMFWKALFEGLKPVLQPILSSLLSQLYKNLLDQLAKGLPSGVQSVHAPLSEQDHKEVIDKTMSDLS
jgi:hypothetical protein